MWKEFFEKHGSIRFKYSKIYTYHTKLRDGWGAWRGGRVKVPAYEAMGTPLCVTEETHPSLEEIYQMFKERMNDENREDK